MIARKADIEDLAQNSNWPVVLMLIDVGELHFWPFAKNAIAFPRMSRSILTRASSARNWRISICSAVSFYPRPLAVSLPDLYALIQFDNVCSITPSDRAASPTLWPDSTRRTASILNRRCRSSSVYAPSSPLLPESLRALYGVRFPGARSQRQQSPRHHDHDPDEPESRANRRFHVKASPRPKLSEELHHDEDDPRFPAQGCPYCWTAASTWPDSWSSVYVAGTLCAP